MRRTLTAPLIATLLPFALSYGQKLGSITFPTSGAAAAQASFVEGVKDLHSFEFDEAAEAFRNAQKADPTFALAYWGEAMSYNHPLWAQLDLAAARKALERLAPTPETRIAKAQAPKEKAYLQAAEALFNSPGDKLARDIAYSQAMARMYDQWPDDPEVDIFYALSLLGSVRPGDQGFHRQALAASLAMKVFEQNREHPGAAHFIIHAFDDPDHAILALPAARVYAKIAPSAPHALHMPSHIFVQLGMWQDVKESNVVAHRAARDLIARMHLPEGREDFHTLSWLEYSYLMLGQFGDAEKNLQTAKEAVERNPANEGIENAYLGMRARYFLESSQWEKIPLDAPTMAATKDTGSNGTAMPGMPGMAMEARYSGRAPWIFFAGYSAAKRGDTVEADKAVAQLRAMGDRTKASGNAYAAKPLVIMEKEVMAMSLLARGQKSEAVRVAKEASDIELTMSAPSGPPEPIKPATELYGEVLLEAGMRPEAAAAFGQSLARTPKRTPSLKGLASANSSTGSAGR